MTELPGLPAPHTKCFAPNCDADGWDMPVIFFGPGPTAEVALERVQVCMLEVPKLVCHHHMQSFRPDTYMSDMSRMRIQRWLREQGLEVPSWRWFKVIWLSSRHRVYQELAETGQARLTGGHAYVGV